MVLVPGEEILASDFIDSSAGAGDSGKGVKLDSDGKLDASIVAILTASNIAQILGGNDDLWVLTNSLTDWQHNSVSPGSVHQISSGATSSVQTNDTVIDTTKDFVMQFVMKNGASSGNPVTREFWGIGATSPNTSGDLTSDHAGFILWATASAAITLEASVADGSTQVTAIITGITITDFNSYRIERVGTDILFYVNGVLKATLSSNLPDNTTSKLAFIQSDNDVFTIKNGIGFVQKI